MTTIITRTGIAAIALALTVSLGGCFAPGGGTPDPVPTETTSVEAGLGVPIRVVQSEGVGELTITNPTWSEVEPSGLPIDSVKGGFLVMDATWTTVEGTTSMIINYNVVENADGEGDQYFFVKDAFAGNDLQVGDTISGQLAFDIGPGPYTFIAYDDFVTDVMASFPFEAEPREGVLWS
ncbi:hypothetical protein [Pseudolysinimonas sp.]|uniref:hypothetical protein n=1 Tax=Pseudolysinimonas sp. TaxID=2680009 RepID=UPI003782FBC9